MNNFNYQKGQVFFRNGFVPFSEANVSIASSPVLYGLAIYTVFNVLWDEKTETLSVFRLKDHYNRLVKSSGIVDFHSFPKEWPYEKFEKTMLELIHKNNIRENVLVRVCVFIDELIAGTKIHGLKNSMSAYVYPMGQILPKSGINVCISKWRRNPNDSIPSGAKINGGYVNVSLMKNDAILAGFDDAIALTTSGDVAESTVANIFMVKDGKLITPEINSSILEGITRDSILKIAKDMGISCEERIVKPEELAIADELFVTGSSAGVVPVLSVDKKNIGNGTSAGEITQKLAATYSAIQTGADSSHSEWRMVL